MSLPDPSFVPLVPVAPEHQIATAPPAERDRARLLVVDRRRATLEDATVADLPRFLAAGDLLVLNDTRVIPARLEARRVATGGRVEILVLPGLARDSIEAPALVQARGELAAGEILVVGEERLELVTAVTAGRARLRRQGGGAFLEVLDALGATPLPPYIERARVSAGETRVPRPEDRERYQTVFAEREGAIAAPTAGLHFTPELLALLAARGVQNVRVTLHVGPGTFLPIRSADPRAHPMEAEWCSVPEASAAAIAETRARGGRIVAVGTTSVRTLESRVAADGRIAAGAGLASLYITPPYTFRVIDGMMTNFHLPDSTPCYLVAALLGAPLLRRAYEHAIAAGYRFYSYGDAMLIV